MRKLGVVLAFVVLFSVLSVSVVPVRAETTTYSAVAYLFTENAINKDLALSTLGGMVDGDHLLAYKSVGLSSPLEIRVYSQKIEVWYSGQSLNDLLPALRVLDPSDVATAGTVELSDIFLVNEAVQVFNDLVTNGAVSGNYYGLDLRFMPNGARVWYHYAVGRSGEGTTTGSTITAGNNTYLVSFEGSAGNHIDDRVKVQIGTTVVFQNDGGYVNSYKLGSWSGAVTGNIYDSTASYGYVYVIITYFDGDVVVSNPFGFLKYLDIGAYTATVTFSFKDALSGESLSGVTVKENGNVIATIDDGETLEIGMGTHTLTFEKAGYWSKTVTVDVQEDMSVSVEMYPSSAAFKLENFPANISIPKNTIYTLTFTLSPIQTSATYNTYLSLSGLSDVLEVRKDGSAISPEGGKYYLGDISSDTSISIKFKAGAVGQHGFTITLTSNDAIMSQTYTTTKQVTYQVEPLPFSVQMPSEWQVGENQLRISESSGQSYLITAVLKDSSGNEVWSDSYAFSPYEAHTFTINVPSEGSYTLELQWNGQTAVYGITVNPAITLVTKTLTVQEGGEGVITLHFKNPSSSVQYYTIKVSGGFLPAEINQSIAVAPYAEKDVSITFAVPEDLTYDAYELNVQVLQGDAVVFQDEVAVSVSGSSGFSLFGGGSGGGKTLYYGLAVLVGLGLFIAILRRR